MTWVSGRRAPERIMLYGPAGAGKSEAILAIAAKVAPRAVRVVDTDYAWNVLLDEYEGDNIEVFEVDAEDWDGLRETVARRSVSSRQTRSSRTDALRVQHACPSSAFAAPCPHKATSRRSEDRVR